MRAKRAKELDKLRREARILRACQTLGRYPNGQLPAHE